MRRHQGEAYLFAVIVSVLAFGTLARAEDSQPVEARSELQLRCEKIDSYMDLEVRKLELYQRLSESFAAYAELEARLPPDYIQVMGAHRFYALLRSEYLPADLMGKIYVWRTKVDKSLKECERKLGKEDAALIWRAYQLRQDQADLVEALAKLHAEQVGTGLENIRSIEAQMGNRGVTFAAFDPNQPQPCW